MYYNRSIFLWWCSNISSFILLQTKAFPSSPPPSSSPPQQLYTSSVSTPPPPFFFRLRWAFYEYPSAKAYQVAVRLGSSISIKAGWVNPAGVMGSKSRQQSHCQQMAPAVTHRSTTRRQYYTTVTYAEDLVQSHTMLGYSLWAPMSPV